MIRNGKNYKIRAEKKKTDLRIDNTALGYRIDKAA